MVADAEPGHSDGVADAATLASSRCSRSLRVGEDDVEDVDVIDGDDIVVVDSDDGRLSRSPSRGCGWKLGT